MTAIDPLDYLYKVSYSGTIGTEEIFVFSRWISAAFPSIQTDIAALLATDITDLLATTVTSGPLATLQQMFPDYVVWTQLKVAPWDQTTNKLDPAQGDPAYEILTDHGSESASAGMTYQTALAVTTRSAAAGRRKYNRFYLPSIAHTGTDGHGLIDVTVANAIVLWLHLNITARAAADPSVVAVNWTPSATVGPKMLAVQDVYLGRRLDTIRRRRNMAPEPRVTDAI